ncbi:hypothetical protein HF313_30185 [Massilia atriviolacea]|uniref:Uncharacterized protein n=1 Tax=Massilia atriviolacea TaxID=2495579 RepID=A0A430HH06_9BURK|nr:hypothetical protein [Massilia atriviolacea]RSZ56805.1 hypothetical protein EJB06_22975 [Massilia atriviolacea]
MNSSEVFIPAGWLALSGEQSAHIKSVLGQDVSAVPVYNVVSRGANKGYQPLNIVPGLACLVVHEDSHQQFGTHGEQARALPGDMARQGEDDAARNAKLKAK